MSSRTDQWTFSAAFTSLELKGVTLTDTKLGKGSDASVFEVYWLGTSCAGKKLHEILLEDDSPGGARRFVQNFEQECLTWSKLNHPRVVQFLGVHFQSASHMNIPVLVLEKMDVSLSQFLDTHSKEDTHLPDKVFILLQTAQALAYLHSCTPPLVHHDLSTNNILICLSSLATKVTDFGMSRALDHSKLTRRSSIKGTPMFMPPEALVDPPKYDEKLDTFSYGNVVLASLTHEWPKPSYPTVCEGDKIVGHSELQRREQYIQLLSQEESQVFLSTIHSCLNNRPSQRPSSIELVEGMRRIETAHPRTRTQDITCLQKDLGVKTDLLQQKDTQLQQKDTEIQCKKHELEQNSIDLQQKDAQIILKDDECKQMEVQLLQKDTTIQWTATQLQQKDAELQQKDAELQQKDAQLQQKDTQLQDKDAELQQMDTELQQKDAEVQQKDAELQQKNAEILQKDTQLQLKNAELSQKDAIDSHLAQTTHPSQRDAQLFQKDDQLQQADRKQWREMKHSSIFVCGSWCYGVATKGDLIAISMANAFELYSKSSGNLMRRFEAKKLGYNLGLAFLDDTALVVSDSDNNSLSLYSTEGGVLWSVDSNSADFKPLGVAVSPDRLVFVCNGATHSISVFDSLGKLVSKFGSYGTSNGQFSLPRDLCFSSDGLVYVTDNGNRRICVHNKAGVFLRQFPCGDRKPIYIAATKCDHLVVTFSLDHLLVYANEGNCVQEFGSHGKEPGQFDRPHGVAVDSEDGLMYIADCQNKRLQVYVS